MSIAADEYGGRITTFVVLSCVVATMGGVIFGYDVGISGGVTSMESFLEEFFPSVVERMRRESETSNYCKFDSNLLTAFTSSLYVAGMVASLAAAPVTRRKGRRATMAVGGAAFVVGAVVGGAAVNLWMLLLGRVLLGIGVGFGNQAVPLYLSEMAPFRHRGAFNNGFIFSQGVGFTLASLINFAAQKISGGWGWRLSLSLAAAPASFLTLGALFLPETPTSLLQTGHDLDKTISTLQKIRGTTDVLAELNDILAATNVDSSITVARSFQAITRRKYRPQLIMAVAMPFFAQVTGFNLVAFYAPELLRTIGLKESASLMSAILIGAIGSIANIIAMIAVDGLGRRPLFVIGGVQMFVAQVVIGGVMETQLGDQGGMSDGYVFVVLILICVFVVGFECSWGPLCWLVPSEIFPLEIRSAGQSIVVATNFLCTFVVAQVFLAMLCVFKASVFFFFAGWIFVMTAFMYLLLPETKNVPIEQMEQVWRKHWFWKRMVEDECSDRRMPLLHPIALYC